jgi:hypothetical protein
VSLKSQETLGSAMMQLQDRALVFHMIQQLIRIAADTTIGYATWRGILGDLLDLFQCIIVFNIRMSLSFFSCWVIVEF